MKSILLLIVLESALLLVPREIQAGGKVGDYRFFSQALGREMTCRVYLPQDYRTEDPGKRFPVIYFLHGASLGYDSYDAIFTIIDNLIAFKQVKPVILVLPDGLAPPYNGSFYTNSDLYGNYEDYISRDLISFIDSAFYTRNERSQRAIMGASMGGYGALKMAFKHQELFIGVAGHSGPVNINLMDNLIPDLKEENGGQPPFHWSPGPGKSLTNLTYTMAGAFSPHPDTLYQVDFPLDSLAVPIPQVMDRWKRENICELARIWHPGSNLGIRFDCGTLDEYYLYYQNRSLADTLTKYGIPYRYDEYLGTHTTGLPVRVILSFEYFDQLFQVDGTDLAKLNTGHAWAVFPNPASQWLNVNRYGFSTEAENNAILFFDPSGKLAFQHALSNGKNEIDISDLPEGVYFYKIVNGEKEQNGLTIVVRQKEN
jgi:enterochelin esterase-like enzyme